jgi:hypothetical protein
VQKSKKGRRAASAQKEGKGGSECRKVRREGGQRVHRKEKGKGDSECRKVRREGGQRVQKSKKGRRAASAQKEGKGGSDEGKGLPHAGAPPRSSCPPLLSRPAAVETRSVSRVGGGKPSNFLF